MPSELWRDQVRASGQEDCLGKAMWEGKPEPRSHSARARVETLLTRILTEKYEAGGEGGLLEEKSCQQEKRSGKSLSQSSLPGPC